VLAADVLAADVLAADVLAADVLAADVLAADVLAADVLAASPDGIVADALVADALVADALIADTLAMDVLASTPAVSPDGIVADVLVADVLAEAPAASPDGSVADVLAADVLAETDGAAPSSGTESEFARAMPTDEPQVAVRPAEAVAPVEIYGDSSYGTAKFVEAIESAGAEANVKVQPPSAPEGKFGKAAFDVDLTNNTVRCPAGVLVVIRPSTGGDGLRFASFGVHCKSCELRSQCTDGKDGRAIRVHPHEATLQRSRMRQRDPAWRARYRATRPKVERKIAHLMQRRHGGRRARVRGRVRVTHDFALLGAAHNFKRLATLGVHYDGGTWRR
jgi:hypothetical protein